MKFDQFIKGLAAVILVSLSWCAGAQTHLSEEARISLLTCSPGNELYSVFGHSALRVVDPVAGIDSVYNYGTFDFETEGFYLKFARGKLDYMLSRQFFPYFQYEYLISNRSIDEQMLILSREECQQVYDLLEENYKLENRFYRYDFFFDNCATRIRDVVQKAFGDRLDYGLNGSSGLTFRDQVEEYTAAMPWSLFGISLALGAPYDREIEGEEIMFLPDDLAAGFSSAKLDGKPLVSESRQILNAETVESASSAMNPVNLGFIFLILILFQLFVEWKRGRQFSVLRKFELILFGLMGWVVLLLWLATDHQATKPNWDVLWLWPLHLLVWPFITRKMASLKFYFMFSAVLIVCCILATAFRWFPIYYLPYQFAILVWTVSFLQVPSESPKQE